MNIFLHNQRLLFSVVLTKNTNNEFSVRLHPYKSQTFQLVWLKSAINKNLVAFECKIVIVETIRIPFLSGYLDNPQSLKTENYCVLQRLLCLKMTLFGNIGVQCSMSIVCVCMCSRRQDLFVTVLQQLYRLALYVM